MKKRCIAAVIAICICFMSIAGYYLILSVNNALLIETEQKLALSSCIEGTITTEDGFVVSSAVSGTQRATVYNPTIYSALVGPRVPSAKPSVYSNNIEEYKDITQTSTLRNALFEYLCMDTDGDGRGSDCVLTINNTLQEYVFNLISTDDMTRNRDTAVVIIENNSGAIKALLSYKALCPEYDVNNFSANYSNISKINDMFVPEFLNPSSPGSTFKVLSSVPIIEKKLENELYYDTGNIAVGGSTISNYKGTSYGTVSLEDAIKNSLNTYFVNMYTTKISSSELESIAKRAMIGEKFETDLWELPSSTRNNNLFETAQASFGQGVSVTPLGMCAAFSGILNNGKMLRPFIVESLSSSSKGVPYYQKKTEVVSSLTDTNTCKTLLSYLQINAKEQYKMQNAVYAKTGTAECGNDKNALWVICGNETYSLVLRCFTDNLDKTGSQLCEVADRILQHTGTIK